MTPSSMRHKVFLDRLPWYSGSSTVPPVSRAVMSAAGHSVLPGKVPDTESDDGDEEPWTSIHDRDPVLHQAAYLGNVRKLKLLLHDKRCLAEIDRKNRLGCSPLRLAATAGHKSCVQYLIQCGADVNISDVKAQTPLFVAVKNKHIECVRMLLDAGANPNGDSASLCSPVYIAAMDGFTPGVEALCKAGADLDQCPYRQGSLTSTPLYITIAYQHYDSFRLLLEYGADPDFCWQMFNKMTPRDRVLQKQSLLHAVVKRPGCPVSYAETLLEFGADPWLPDDRGKRPHELPVDNDCKEYLRRVIRHPMPLTALCRLTVRRSVGRRHLSLLSTLPVPHKVLQYLQYNTS